jgi:uncharacterized protein YjbJ (UPF0337 family)
MTSQRSCSECASRRGPTQALNCFSFARRPRYEPDGNDPLLRRTFFAITRFQITLITCDTRSNPMNWDRVEGNWKEFKGQVQKQWGKLTNDDLDVIEGKRKELAGRLQQRYGYAKDEAEREIDMWLKDAA